MHVCVFVCLCEHAYLCGCFECMCARVCMLVQVCFMGGLVCVCVNVHMCECMHECGGQSLVSDVTITFQLFLRHVLSLTLSLSRLAGQ